MRSDSYFSQQSPRWASLFPDEKTEIWGVEVTRFRLGSQGRGGLSGVSPPHPQPLARGRGTVEAWIQFCFPPPPTVLALRCPLRAQGAWRGPQRGSGCALRGRGHTPESHSPPDFGSCPRLPVTHQVDSAYLDPNSCIRVNRSCFAVLPETV